MNRFLHFIVAFTCALLCTGCIKQLEEELPGLFDEGESWVSLYFGDGSFNSVQIETKTSEAGIVAESKIKNIYLFIFDSNGNRVYRHFFDSHNQAKVGSAADAEETAWAQVQQSKFDAWYVINSVKTSDKLGDTDSNTRTRGRIWLKAPHLSEGEIYAVANIDGDMVNISPEKLDLVETKADLLNLTCHLNQLITTRMGYFTMVAHQNNITVQGEKKSLLVGDDQVSGPGSSEWQLHFERVDAKVEFRVQAAMEYTYYDGNGDPADPNTTTRQRVKSFQPDSWQVINIPKGCSLIDSGLSQDNSAAEEEGYFNTEPRQFEETEHSTVTIAGTTYNTDVHRFFFYMMENREPAKSAAATDLLSASDYHKRDLRLKKADGSYEFSSGDMWKYAPEYATYVVIKGDVQMEINVTTEAKTQTLNALATYIVHLGDFATDVKSFSIFRNTSYVYTITIKGVDKIALEVTTSSSGDPALVQELNAGAMGNVNLAREATFTFDAHYGQRVFCFDAEQIDINNTYWYVKTPFGKEGTPPRVPPVTGQDMPTGYDYKWVWFMVNDYCESSELTDVHYKDSWEKYYENKPSMDGLLPYRQKNQSYPGEHAKEVMVNGHKKLMDVVEFMAFLREQKQLYEADNLAGRTGNDRTNLFRDEWDQSWYDWAFQPAKSGEYWSGGGRTHGNPADEEFANNKAHRHRIYVTCYVDEFYYDEDPINPSSSPQDLWKRFVNQPNRMMFILSDNKFSLDGDSSATGSVITIRQRSIQTPYNVEREALKTAWGAEVVDETEGFTYFYNKNEGVVTSSKAVPTDKYIDLPVNTKDNGLYNTVSNWLLISGGEMRQDEPWANHLDFDRYNDGSNYVFLKDDEWNATLRWACLMRNRDNNGNQVIDADEVHWYMATSQQIQHMFFGNLGISDEAATYSKSWTTKPGRNDPDCPVHPVFGRKVDLWRRHFITSSIDNGANNQHVPDMVRVEEGPTSSVGNYRDDMSYDSARKMASYTMRCVRNLGIGNPDNVAIANKTNTDLIPESFIKVSRSGDVFIFDCENINTKSLRGYYSRDLEPSDEFGENAKLYKRFETGPQVSLAEFGGNTTGSEHFRYRNYTLLHDMLRRGESPCPDGYRVPNIREGAILFLFAKPALSSNTLVSTYLSNSTFNSNGLMYVNEGGSYPSYPAAAGYTQYGNGNDFRSTGQNVEKGKNSWVIMQNRITISLGGFATHTIRCVRDVKVD